MQPAVYSVEEAAAQSGSALPVSPSKARFLDSILLSLSIASNAFLPIWQHVLSEHQARYFQRTAPDMRTLLALLVDVLTVAWLLFCSLRLRKRLGGRWRRGLTAVSACIALYALFALQLTVYTALRSGGCGTLGLCVATAAPWVIAGGLLARSAQHFKAAVRMLFLVLSPLFFVLASSGIWQYAGAARDVRPGQAAGMLPKHASSRRVIWIIFDELDGRIIKAARPARVNLTEFDRLAAASLDATAVNSPGSNTSTAIPSLLLGKIVVDKSLGMPELMVRFRNDPDWKSFRSQPSLFSRARNAGFDAGVSGWHYPYCRILGAQVSDCAWEIGGSPFDHVQRQLGRLPLYQQAGYLFSWDARKLGVLLNPLQRVPPFPDNERLWRDSNIETAKYVFGNALRMLRNRELNLVFIHLPVPHPPGIWNAREKRFSDGAVDYVDNLQLSDNLLGQMRRTLENSGDWDTSTILVSSDHPFRPALWSALPFWTAEMTKVSRSAWQPRIPFLLKLPGQRRRVEYQPEFNSVVSADLLFAALTGQVRSSAEAVQWLDAHRTAD